MQFIPTISADNSLSAFSNVQESSQSSGDFMLAMREAMDAVANGDNFSVSNALDDSENAPLVESPYSRHTTDGVTYTLSEVCFSKNELQELREQLIKEGAPVESLRDFDVLAGQPDGATLAQVLASLTGKSGAVELSDDDIHAITAFLGQIDPSGVLAGDALGFMQAGNPSAAMDLIRNALGSADSIDVDVDSLMALGRGLGLNADTLRAMAAGLGGLQSARVSGAQLDTLLNPAKNQILSDAANAQKLEAALEKTLKPIISKARDRMEKEQEATQRESRRVQQSKILIDRTVQQNSREILDETLAGENPEAGKQTAKQAATLAGAQTEVASRAAQQASNQPDGSQTRDAGMRFATDTAGAKTFTDQENNSASGQKENSSDWQDLAGKLETRAANPLAPAASLAYSMVQGSLQSGMIDADAAMERNIPQLPQQVAGQVQQGLLTAMGDGATRLDLQLHPAELGAITITLVARNGEVTAQIRSEKSETVDIINRQADTIRVNLEQQGVKVDKIEVQLENRDQRGNTFADLGQHNARQEEDARRQELNRLRNLASLRNNSENEDNSILAQDMHIMGNKARYAGQSLHVVA